ncbi:hypothetical protein NUW58_g2036 [Xylaria curta]|uniref:Uncharacterized protein n=1 Tax=Xylaria curta TaxID=42375 RepID=A0ACC1PK18_9PEZI|nr:hypothetical protein NUW58_g2036 [Xylaria curta]
MARKTTPHHQSTSKSTRCYCRHCHRHKASHHNDEDRSAIPPAPKESVTDATVQDSVPRIYIWSKPTLDAHGYQWAISGSDSGSNPHFLSPASDPNGVYPSGIIATTYPASSYTVPKTVQGQPIYNDPSDVTTGPVDFIPSEGTEECSPEDYHEEEAPVQDEQSNDFREERRDKQSHHRHHHQHHYRSQSHKKHDRRFHAGHLQACNITISDQADIEDGRLSSCPSHTPLYVSVRNATNILNFTGLTVASRIDVTHSPQLRVLDFPQLKRLDSLFVNEANDLSSVFLQQLSSLPPKIYDDGSYSLGDSSAINITGSPSLTQIDLQAATGLHVLALRDVLRLSSSLNPNITSVVILESNACAGLPALASVRNLHLIGRHITNCFQLAGLTSVLNFTLTNIGPREITFGQTALAVTDTLVLESSVVDPSYLDSTLDLSPVTSVGGNAFITSNENLHIDLDTLDSVKGNLSINNNQNCTFSFNHLGEVGNLLLTDNLNTVLPSFPSLARANNIHLRGHIDQSNIFPALTRVSGTVTIEAWNDDFNCSKLTSQHQEDIISNLNCNGTNNGTQASSGGLAPSPTPPPPDNGLSQGVKAGIGVGVTVGVLGAAIALVWLILRFKIRVKELSQRRSALPPTENGGVSEPQPDEQIHEIDERMPTWMHQVEGRMIIHENPGNDIHELPSTQSGFPGGPALQVNKAAGPLW